MKRNAIQNIYSLSATQEGLLFHSLTGDNPTVYFEQVRLGLEGTIDRKIFEHALQALVERHDALRTVFTFKKTQKPRQIVLRRQLVTLDYQELNEEAVVSYLERNLRTGFDLGKGPLMRVALFKTGESTYSAIWSFHHIIMDGWCFGILMRDFVAIYYHLANQKPYSVPSPPSYSDYIAWLERQSQSRALGFWREYLEGYKCAVSLPGRETNREGGAYRQRQFTLELDGQINQRVREFSKQANVTLHSFYSALWGLVLHCFNDCTDAVFGNVTAGRPAELPHSQEMVGLFINTIPLRVQVDHRESFMQLLKNLTRWALDWKRHEYLPLADIQATTDLKRNVFDHIFGLENFPLGETIRQTSEKMDIGFVVNGISVTEQTNYHLNVMVNAGGVTRVYFIYNESIYDPAVIQSAGQCLSWLAEHLTEHPDQPLSRCQWLSPPEMERILHTLNATGMELPEDWSVLHRLYHFMDTAPDRSVSFDLALHSVTTYGFLRECVTNVSSRIQKQGLGKGDIVALMTDRGFECLAGMVAILRAGCVYLPLDRYLPEERTAFMIKDSGARLLLSHFKTIDHLEDVPQLDLKDSILVRELNRGTITPPAAEDPAYVIYTSGSTGTPKGVMISHGSLGNYLHGAAQVFDRDFSSRDRGLCQSSICFDVSTVEMFLPLVFGGSLGFAPGDWNYEPARVAGAIMRTAATFAMIPPSLLEDVCGQFLRSTSICPLDKLLTGLELIEDSTLERYYQLNRHIKLVNGYGPTETTICATMFRHKGGAPTDSHIPIGKPMANVQAIILDSCNRMLPEGAVGEIYIGGSGVGAGYVNRPELTEERFVQKPSPGIEGRWYRTGDLGSLQSSGDIFFEGRNDRQVKIRGYRVELGEIERRLCQYDNIKQAVVAVKHGAGNAPYLRAYLVTESGDIDDMALRSFLRQRLPEYMIPAHLTEIPEIPLTPNGKIDRRRLPEPGAGDNTQKILPANPTEIALAAIWADLLDIPQQEIGIDEHFFFLGGHSLTISRMVARVHQELGVAIQLREVMANPYIRSISCMVSAAKGESPLSIAPIEKKDYYPLAQAQRSQFALYRQYPDSTQYNISHALEVKGRLRHHHLQQAFASLVRRHESLRTSFHIVERQPVQRIHPNIEFALQELDNPDIDSFIQPFQLEEAPLLRVGLVSLSAELHMLLVDMHHIIADGISAGIIIDECVSLYSGKALPQLMIQYKDFSAWEAELQAGEAYKEQLEYWRAQFTPMPEPLELPKDYPAKRANRCRAGVLETELDATISKALQTMCKANDCTLFTVMSAMTAILLGRLGGGDDVVLGIPENGRHHPSLQSVIGMFVNTLPLRFRFPQGFLFREFLTHTKTITAGALENRDVGFVDLVRHLGLQGKSIGNPLFDVMLTVDNLDIPPDSLGDLQIKTVGCGDQDVKFDLMAAVQQQRERISIRFVYAKERFESQTIGRWLGYLERIIGACIADPLVAVHDIELLDKKEKRDLLVHLTGAPSGPSHDASIVDCFGNQVLVGGGRVALVHSQDGTHISYGTMDQIIRKRTAALRERGVGRDSIVGIWAERQLDTIIDIFAVLCAGAAYLPLDPSWPRSRVDFILEDSGALLMPQPDIEAGSRQKFEALPGDAAYIMYTSGSTGIPKGMVIDHGCVTRVVVDSNYMTFYKTDRVLQLSTIAFDGSVFDIFGALLNGGALVLLRRETILSPVSLGRCIVREAVTAFFMTAALFNVMVDEALDSFRWTRIVVFGGEQASPHHVRQAFGYLGGGLINGYGPTESTVFAVCHPLTTLDHCRASIPIGTPITNTSLRIVDSHMRQTPIGVPGELLIGGGGLGRGYMNRPQLTDERFVTIQDPLSGEASRFYRSGDLVKLREDGLIEFLGRMDQQLKIRGFRIEPGEIETCLCNHPSIQEAVVIPYHRGESGAVLAAYVVPWQESVPQPEEWLNFLRQHLPPYMIPAFLIPMGNLPLNANGKVNRQALPLPPKEGGVDIERPQTDRQRVLAAMWSQLLGIDDSRTGLDDDFFESGGHSLLAAVLVKRVAEEFSTVIPLVDFLQRPTIRRIDSLLQKGKPETSQRQAVSLRSGGHRKEALFFLHAGSGEVDGYVSLCRRLETDAACWGIRVDREMFRYPANIEIQELSARYIDIVRDIQPEGPYRLTGWCVGGTIAFEMALQLRQMGEEVNSLTLINSAAPGTFPNERSHPFTLEAEQALLESVGITQCSNATSIPELWDHFLRLNIDAGQLSSWIPESWRQTMPEPGTVPAESYLRSIFIARSLDRARALYIPSVKFDRPLHYIGAADARIEGAIHWQTYSRQPVQRFEVPGDHFSILSALLVNGLAIAMKGSLAMEGNRL
jgi:amino acid adenylation domain-containing protein